MFNHQRIKVREKMGEIIHSLDKLDTLTTSKLELNESGIERGNKIEEEDKKLKNLIRDLYYLT